MAREHHHPAGSSNRSRPFDVEHHAAGELTEQFWGDTRSWTPADDADPDAPGDELWAERTGSFRAIRDGLVGRRRRATDSGRIAAARSAARRTGGMDRTRSHGIVRPGAPRPDDRTDQLPRIGHTARVAAARGDATLGQLASGAEVDDWTDDDWDLLPANPTRSTGRVAATAAPRVWQAEIELDDRRRPAPRPAGIGALAERLGLGAVDPLLMRLGVLVLTGALAIPFAIGFGDDGDGSLAGGATPVADAAPIADTAAQPGATSAAVDIATQTVVAAEPAPAGGGTAAAAEPAGPETTDPGTTDPGVTATTVTTTPPTATTEPDSGEAVVAPDGAQAATVSVQAARVEPECALEYTAAPGDSWYRIADAAGITVDDLLDANLAQLDAPIYPGDEICLPEGATMPAPPTTTVAPSTTAPPATVAPTTVAPTTVPSTTVPSSPSALASPEEVQRLIREIFPAELHEKALEVAWRESNYRANAYNGWCCYGVFQIYWTVHRSWLDDFGINSTADLYDARKNITAAYALYQRAGGWGPWGG